MFAEDTEFWQSFGGWNGFRRKMANAKAFVHLCQTLPDDCDIAKEDIEFMANRAMLIMFYFSCSMPEAVARLFVPAFPHSCAKVSAQIYWEMEGRITTLCGGSVFDQLHTML
jgi:hypothetical protein